MKNPIKKIMVFAVVLVIYFIAAFTFIINNILNYLFITLQKQNNMKKLIFIVLIAFASCSKQVDTTQQQLQQVAEPIAEIISTVKTYSGSNPSLRITYTLKSISSVKAIRLNNTLPILVKEGQSFIQDPAAGFTNNYFYYWVFDMQDGSQKITNPKQYFF